MKMKISNHDDHNDRMWSGQGQHLPPLSTPHPLQQLVLLPTPNLLQQQKLLSTPQWQALLQSISMMPMGCQALERFALQTTLTISLIQIPWMVIKHVDHACKSFLSLSTTSLWWDTFVTVPIKQQVNQLPRISSIRKEQVSWTFKVILNGTIKQSFCN